MADDQKENDVDTEAQPPKKSPVGLILILGIVVIVLGAGGFWGWNQFVNKDATGTETEKQATEGVSKRKKREIGIVVPLESFIVNLLDKAGLGKRYLKITVELEVISEQDQLLLDSHKTRLRDTILLLLSGLSFDEVNTIEGKLDLKQALLSRINQIMGGGIVRRIYFTEFVVQ